MSEGFSRRSFLKLAATAGAAALPGCEPAARKLIPYVVPDENVIPGVPQFYATSCTECGAGCGTVARIREGRVIKLEGNPANPIGQGTICARGHAALQGVYNPDRLRNPMQRTSSGALKTIPWEEANKLLNDALKAASAKGKNRVAFLGQAHQGPTLRKITEAWLAAYQSNRGIFYEAITDTPARDAAEMCFGRRDLPVYHLDKAEVLISFGADFNETWRSPVELGRQYGEFRAPKTRQGKLSVGYSYYVSPRFNVTAARCDEWVSVPPGAEAAIALSVLHVVLSQGWVSPNAQINVADLKNFVSSYDPASVSQRTGVPVKMIEAMGERFGKADGAVALAAGDDPATHAAAYVLNAVTGNLGRTMEFLEGAPPEPESSSNDMVSSLESMRNGAVDVLFVAETNPVFSMPAKWQAAEAIKKVPLVVWAGGVPDETAAHAHLLLPLHHQLEDWRDTFPRAGVHGLGQPVMQPVFFSRPLGDLLIASARESGVKGAAPWENTQDAVRSGWEKLNPKAAKTDAKGFWVSSLREGGYFEPATAAQVTLNVSALKTSPATREIPKLALAAYPHPFLYDGRGADKPWLQEIPEPVTQLVWDTWAEIHPETARKHGISKDEIIEIRSSEGAIRAPAFLSERVHKGIVSVPIGQGHSEFGRYAKGRGANPWEVLKAGRLCVAVTIHPTRERRELVSALYEGKELGRPIVEAMTATQLADGVQPKEWQEPEAPEPYEMYPAWNYPKHHWGMTIDANACTGCSACVAACYAENNVPFVGREGVNNGRIMSWIRLERFFPQKEYEHQPLMFLTPMLCQQCNHAPCEPVCPVFASYHTAEGLNGQAYNRCIGTRFCENNCPYKVRRFNFWKPEWPEPLNYQLNPDVTVRGAGVMEKCTFCVQRIRYAEITALVEKRPVHDGEIIPACAQTCPTNAISFGDMNDKRSKMMLRRVAKENKGRTYKSLKSLNTLPAITYLRELYNEREKA